MRMNGITNFFDNLFNRLSSLKFEHLLIADLCAFGVIFLTVLILCIFSKKMRIVDKRPFLCAVNVFTALTFAVFATTYQLAYSAAAAAAFWCVGYLSYGLLTLFKPATPYVSKAEVKSSAVSSYRPVQTGAPIAMPPPAVQSGVRLEHALSIADKLLLKNLGRGDRQELEKIKTSLTVLKVKGTLTPQEGEQLNDMFNALLKFMAKYDL